MAENLALDVELDLSVINCGECGGLYAILERYRLSHYRAGTCWTCPYCKCEWGYSGAGENAKLKRRIEEQNHAITRARKETEWAKQEAKHAEHRRRGELGAKNRIKRRIANGICPCCHRSFKNLHRHMQAKHPDYSSAN